MASEPPIREKTPGSGRPVPTPRPYIHVSRQMVAAGHAVDLCCGIIRFLRGEEHVDRRELRRLTGSAQRCVLAEIRHLLGWLTAAWLKRRPDRPGAATALTRMPFSATCFASAFVPATMAALVEE